MKYQEDAEYFEHRRLLLDEADDRRLGHWDAPLGPDVFPWFEEGKRVRLRHDVDRYPHFIAPKGAVGTIVTAKRDIFAVKLDETLSGAEEWANEVHWYPLNGDVPTADLEVVKS